MIKKFKKLISKNSYNEETQLNEEEIKDTYYLPSNTQNKEGGNDKDNITDEEVKEVKTVKKPSNKIDIIERNKVIEHLIKHYFPHGANIKSELDKIGIITTKNDNLHRHVYAKLKSEGFIYQSRKSCNYKVNKKGNERND